MSIGPGQTALVVGAHPDDAEFGCYGVLQRFATKEILVLTGGENGGPEGQRRDEAARAAQLIGATITVGDLPDSALTPAPAIAAISEVLERVRPDVVFCPSRHDDHQDHATAAHAAYVATRARPGLVLSFYTPSAAARFEAQAIFVLADAEWQAKLAALGAHRSQSHRSYLSDEYVDTTGRYWALQAGATGDRAEPFEVLRWIAGPGGRPETGPPLG